MKKIIYYHFLAIFVYIVITSFTIWIRNDLVSGIEKSVYMIAITYMIFSLFLWTDDKYIFSLPISVVATFALVLTASINGNILIQIIAGIFSLILFLIMASSSMLLAKKVLNYNLPVLGLNPIFFISFGFLILQFLLFNEFIKPLL